MSRRKQAAPKRHAIQWLPSTIATSLSVTDDVKLSPNVRPVKRQRRSNAPRIDRAKVVNAASDPLLAFAELVFSAHDHDLTLSKKHQEEALEQKTLLIELVKDQRSLQHAVQLNDEKWRVQVRINAPSEAAARALLELVAAGRLSLALAHLPCLDHLLDASSAATPGNHLISADADAKVGYRTLAPQLYITRPCCSASEWHNIGTAGGRGSSQHVHDVGDVEGNAIGPEMGSEDTTTPLALPSVSAAISGAALGLPCGIALSCDVLGPFTPMLPAAAVQTVSSRSSGLTAPLQKAYGGSELLPARHLSRRLAVMLGSDDDGSSGSEPSGTALEALYVLQVGLGPAAWNHVASGPEDVTRRPWQQQLLLVLQWLLPHAAAHMEQAPSILLEPASWGAQQHQMPPKHPPSPLPSPAATTAFAPASMLSSQTPDAQVMNGMFRTAAVAADITAPPPIFEASQLYAAVKPFGHEPMYDGNLPQLIPTLRPYQRRAVQWMLTRERRGLAAASDTPLLVASTGAKNTAPAGVSGAPQLQGSSSASICLSARLATEGARGCGAGLSVVSAAKLHAGAAAPPALALHPLWHAVRALPPLQGSTSASVPAAGQGEGRDASAGCVCCFINLLTGLISRERFGAAGCGADGVAGGILSDEMGLGKTVELLACILANQFDPLQAAQEPAAITTGDQAPEDGPLQGRSGLPERIDCVCGKWADDPGETNGYRGLWLCCDACNAWMHGPCVGHPVRAPMGQFMCRRCLRAHASKQVHKACGATLIVVPSPILQQWWDEILRHTQPRALRVVVYSGQVQGLHGGGVASGGGGGAGGSSGRAALRSSRSNARLQRQVSRSSVHSSSSSSDEGCTGNEGDSSDGGAVPKHQRRQQAQQQEVPAPQNSSGTAWKGVGVHQQVVTAADLAAADVVLTTYDVLKSDLARQPELVTEVKVLRRNKRYDVLPTPLTRLHWWRVVLDEAQMVECSTAKATEMALKLSTVHRWCVTGTPISRGLEDVYGLLAFLKCRPWRERTWWVHGLQRPVEMGHPGGMSRLLALLQPASGGLMWRSAKKDVEHELDVPRQHGHLTLLHLSAVERHFYSRQHAECAQKARDALPAGFLGAAAVAGAAVGSVDLDRQHRGSCGGTGGTSQDTVAPGIGDLQDARVNTMAQHARGGPGNANNVNTAAAATTTAVRVAAAAAAVRPLTAAEQKKLLLPLLRLRQACCHPQVGAGGIKAVTAQRAPMTMDEILDMLLVKAKLEAEEGQRQLVAALNGLAALMLVEGSSGGPRAAAAYREALAVMEANKQDVGNDPLQRLHTLHNLSRLLAKGVPGAARTLSDDHLATDADAIRDKYLAQRAAKLASATADCDKHRRAASPFQAAEDVWFWEAADLLSAEGRAEEVVQQIRAHLLEKDAYRGTSVNASSMANSFRSLISLKVLLKKELDGIETARALAVSKLDELATACASPSCEMIEQAGGCGRCRAVLGVQGRLCEHCGLDELLLAWEVRLFRLDTRAVTAGGRVSAEEAARRAHQQILRQVGRGGLNEQQGDGDHNEGSLLQPCSRRDGNQGALNAQVVWLPSEAEQVLKLLLALLGRYVKDSAGREQVLEAGRSHLRRLEAQRAFFGPARALSLAQRTFLYAHDELEMAVLQIRLRSEGEAVLPHEVGFKLHPAEVPAKNTDLSADKAVAQADLRRTLGTLRYLQTLKAARQQSAAATAAAAVAAAAVARVRNGAVVTHKELQLKLLPHALPQNTPLNSFTNPGLSSSGARDAEEGSKDSSRAGNNNGMGDDGQRGDDGSFAASPKAPRIPPSASEQQQQQLLEWREQQRDRQRQQQQQATAAVANAQPSSGHPMPSAQQDAHTPLGADMGMARLPPVESVPADAEHCPICHDPVGDHFAMYPCGHVVCADCSTTLVDRLPTALPYVARRIACPTCRTRTHVADIAAVNACGAGSGSPDPAVDDGSNTHCTNGIGTASLWSGEADIHVAGQYGCKIEAVVRRLLHIMRSDPATKILVFSSWSDCLELLAHALAANHVPHIYAKGRRQLQQALTRFKMALQPAAGTLPGCVLRWKHQADEHVQSQRSRSEHLLTRDVLQASTDTHLDKKANRRNVIEAGAELKQENHINVVGPFTTAPCQPRGTKRQLLALVEGTSDVGTAVPFATRQTSVCDAAVSYSGPASGSKRSGQAGCVPSTAAGGPDHAADVLDAAATNNVLGPALDSCSRGKASNVADQQAARILLLLVSQGGAGLNLTEAQHVVMVEPLLDLAAEMQCIGRVHRIGQQRETHVHRFVVHNTVEGNVHALAQQRAAGMDMAAATPVASRRGGGGRGSGGPEALTVQDVAVLLRSGGTGAKGGEH